MMEQVFKCPVCKKACADPKELWLHRQEVHNGKIYEHSI